MEANTLYDSYREQYYEGGVSSVYLWDTEDSDAVDGGSDGGLGATGFAGCFLIKKAVAGHKYVDQGSWDSIHVVEVQETSKTTASYKLTSTVILDMNVKKEAVGDCNVAGTMTKQASKTSDFDPKVKPHICVLGSMIEDMEIELRYVGSQSINQSINQSIDQLFIVHSPSCSLSPPPNRRTD